MAAFPGELGNLGKIEFARRSIPFHFIASLVFPQFL